MQKDILSPHTQDGIFLREGQREKFIKLEEIPLNYSARCTLSLERK